METEGKKLTKMFPLGLDFHAPLQEIMECRCHHMYLKNGQGYLTDLYPLTTKFISELVY